MIEISLGSENDKTYVNYRLEPVGRDWILLITGGDSHIGSVAVTEKESKNPDEIWQKTLTIHKEGGIVRTAVSKLSKVLSGELLVVGGVHYDDINKSQIFQIVNNCNLLLEKLVEMVQKGKVHC
jgi:hypothetical protein